MVLERIISNKREEVSARKGRRPLDAVRDNLSLSERSFEGALKKGRTGFVLECKKASPSRGLIRQDFDPAVIARDYARYADAVSVLADERFFQGSVEHVQAVRQAVQIPVLFKDFIIEPYQIFEAREAGADAVLLMLSVLEDEAYRSCRKTAESLEMDALTEVHDEKELERAVGLGARIIGINNRNLKTLEVDLSTTERLARQIPKDRVLVAESGIGNHSDAQRLRSLVDAFLVGTSLMKQADITKACKRLIFGAVKVCGLTRESDAIAAFEAGALYGGLIFADGSPRRLGQEQAQRVRSSAPLDWVGVFANDVPRRVAAVARDLDLKAVQLHGEESSDYIVELRGLLPNSCEIWKALRIGGEIPKMNQVGVTRFLLDTFSAERRGGTGKSFDWSLLEGVDMSNVILSGGLNPGNAVEADGKGAFALDVNSGVEISPGVKSPDLLGEFFTMLRGTGRNGVSV